jgi:hypothetical protein
MISYCLTPCQHYRKVLIFNDNLINCIGVHGMNLEFLLFVTKLSYRFFEDYVLHIKFEYF